MARAHVVSTPSITDALHHTFSSFLRHPHHGGDIAPLAHYLVDVATSSIPSQRIPRRGAPLADLDDLVTTSLRTAIAGVPAAVAPLGDLATGADTRIRLRRTVAEWARDEVSLAAVLSLFDRGFDIVFSALAAHATDPDGFSPQRFGADVTLLVDVRAAVTTAVVGVFAEMTPEAATTTESARHAFTTHLLSGRVGVEQGRELGLGVFERYQVVALSVGPQRRRPDVDEAGTEPRCGLRSAVTRVLGGKALALLSDVGGTVVLPVARREDLVDADTLAALTEMMGVDVTATRTHGPAASIPEMAGNADELLDLVHTIGRPAGLYTMNDLVMEYQITRPGPAHDRLAALIAPLEAHADLLQTLRVHMRCGMNRRETARILSIHPNTVDNRMARVSALLGLDLGSPGSIARMQSAILAFDTGGGRSQPMPLPSSA